MDAESSPDRSARAGGLDALFRRHRRTLWGLSYRLTGCAADADDVVQETFARAAARRVPTDAAADASWRPWLVRVATNCALDILRRRRRAPYVGMWLPSPIDTDDERQLRPAGVVASAETTYEWRESLTFAFLLALEALTPRQRAVLLLRDVLGYTARATAGVLAVSEENVRITHLRARRAMRTYDRTRCRPTRALEERTQRVLAEFVRCLVTQDAAGAEALLIESVRTVTDGGGDYTALASPLTGRARVLTLHLRVAARRAAGARVEIRSVNGLPAVVIEYARAVRRQAPRAVLRCELGPGGLIRELQVILARRKLSAIRR